MNINRHNYEEFFILYLDNELSHDDRRMVEEFAALHPDLKEELDLLQQYKLSPDTQIKFRGKEELLKINGESPVTIHNYEEWFLLYADEELNAEQRTAVEKFIAVNPGLQKELALIRQLKLQPELIVFAGKESLYRKEEKVRSLFYRWRQVAAAVLLLLGLSVTTILVFNNRKSGNPDIAKGNDTREIPVEEKNNNAPDIKEITAGNNNSTSEFTPTTPAPELKQQEKNKLADNNNRINEKKNIPVKTLSPVKKDEQVIAENNKPTNNLPQPDHNPNVNNTDATNNAVANIKPTKEIIVPEKSLTNEVVTNQTEETSPLKNNSIQFAKLEENGENKKSRGFLRKLIRTFEKRTDISATDDGKLLVGGFSIHVK